MTAKPAQFVGGILRESDNCVEVCTRSVPAAPHGQNSATGSARCCDSGVPGVSCPGESVVLGAPTTVNCFKNSGIAWLREDTRELLMEGLEGLSNNVAKYRAAISALKKLPPRANVEIRTDSLLVVSQLRGESRILDLKVARLAAEVKSIAEQKQLSLKLIWTPRQANLGGEADVSRSVLN
jgi:hypothetical protein